MTLNRRTWLAAGAAICTAPAVWATDSVRRQVRWTVELLNPLSRELTDQTVWLYAPAAEGPTQMLEALRLSVPVSTTRDALRHTVVRLDVPRLPPFGRRIVGATATLLMRDKPPPELLVNASDWLRHERFIEVNDPAVRALAATLRRETPGDTARAIYDWVQLNLTYAGFVPEDHGAAEALLRRRGDCTEYAYLVTALARANGLPARMIGGHDVDRDTVLRAADYHNWSEVHFDGAWQLVDAQKQRWCESASNYVAFRTYRDAATNAIGLAHRYAVQGDMLVIPG